LTRIDDDFFLADAQDELRVAAACFLISRLLFDSLVMSSAKGLCLAIVGGVGCVV